MPQTIEMHFKEIMGLAENMDELARKLCRTAEEEIPGIVGSTKAGWNSHCMDILAGKEVKTAAALAAEADRLKELSAETEARAKEMYQWEMTNIRLAVHRTYY